MLDDQKENQGEKEIIYEEADEAGDVGIARLKEKIIGLKEKLSQCREDKQEYLTGWQREKADFLNFKRRQEEQMAEWIMMSQAGLINDLLPVLDSLDQSITVKIEGVDVIKRQLNGVLKKNGLEEVKAVGEKFNPEFHEAIERVEADGEEDIVIEEAQKGYTLNGKVLRTSKVKVSKK